MVMVELQNSKAHLTKQITIVLEANYHKQIQILNEAKALEENKLKFANEKITELQLQMVEKKPTSFVVWVILIVIGIIIGFLLSKVISF